MNIKGQIPSDAAARYLLLVDISGYTAFLESVERTHGVDFSSGIPAGYRVLGNLLEAVVDGIQPTFDVVKLEGDAVFGAALAEHLDGHATDVLDLMVSVYLSFVERRDAARSASDDRCTACSAVSALDLKMILNRGMAVRQAVGAASDLQGPAVNVAHRLLKNSVRERIGPRPYLLITATAATALGDPEFGLPHREQYPDVGTIETRIVDLAVRGGLLPPGVVATEPWPEIRIPST